MQDFHKAKNSGLAGVIIVLVMNLTGFFAGFLWLSLLSYVLIAFSLAGWALVLFSLYIFSKFYQEEAIFRYALYFIALMLVGVILSNLMGIAALASLAGGASISEVLGFAFLTLIIAIVASIIAYYFMYRSLSLLTEKSGEKSFKTAGILMLVGIAATIIVIGVFIWIAGIIVLAIAFASVKPPTEAVQPPTPEHGAGGEPGKQQPESP